jgi:hypothetical protein
MTLVAQKTSLCGFSANDNALRIETESGADPLLVLNSIVIEMRMPGGPLNETFSLFGFSRIVKS